MSCLGILWVYDGNIDCRIWLTSWTVSLNAAYSTPRLGDNLENFCSKWGTVTVCLERLTFSLERMGSSLAIGCYSVGTFSNVDSLNELIKDCTNPQNISSALTSKKEEFKGLKPTDCLPSVWSMILQTLMAQWFLSHPSWLMTDSQHIEFGADSCNTKPAKSWKSCNSEASSYTMWQQSADAAPAKDLEGNICRLIQPLECEDHTIYHW